MKGWETILKLFTRYRSFKSYDMTHMAKGGVPRDSYTHRRKRLIFSRRERQDGVVEKD